MIYKKGLKTEEKKLNSIGFNGVISYVLDFFQVIWWIYSKKDVYDVFIGVNNLNAFAELFLKKIGKVKKVIFYTMDFVPIRFENRILNYIYHQIEIIAIKKSDETWNVSPRMSSGREKYLKLSVKKYPQRFIPVGIWNDTMKKRSFQGIKKHQLLFIGHLLEKQGIQIVLDALPQIKKEIPDVSFLIIGGGEYEDELKSKVATLHLEKNVIFAGWNLDRDKLENILSESAIGVAVYKPEKEWLRNFTYYADPYKIKDYLGAGLAIILTDISYNVKDVERNKCGIIVEYNKDEVADAILRLMKDEKVLKYYRENSLRYAKKFDCMDIYDKIFMKS